MTKDKNPGAGQPSEPKGESGAAQNSFTNPETERRLAALEKSTADLNNRVFDSHKWFVTVLFSFVAVMLTVYGVLSRLDVRESTKEMEVKVDKATGEMERKFQALAGEALKKPALELLNERVPLEGQVVEAWGQSADDRVVLSSLFLKNFGDKRTEPLSIRISMSVSLRLSHAEPQDWERAPSLEKEYTISFYSTRHATIAPGETMNIHPLIAYWEYTGDDNRRADLDHNTNVVCKIRVFYGGESPAEAIFQIKPKWR